MTGPTNSHTAAAQDSEKGIWIHITTFLTALLLFISQLKIDKLLNVERFGNIEKLSFGEFSLVSVTQSSSPPAAQLISLSLTTTPSERTTVTPQIVQLRFECADETGRPYRIGRFTDNEIDKLEKDLISEKERNLESEVAMLREKLLESDKRANLAGIVLVGSADRRQASKTAANPDGSNNWLALERAKTVEALLQKAILQEVKALWTWSINGNYSDVRLLGSGVGARLDTARAVHVCGAYRVVDAMAAK